MSKVSNHKIYSSQKDIYSQKRLGSRRQGNRHVREMREANAESN